MTTPLLLEHHDLTGWCGRCHQVVLPYEVDKCPRCGQEWTHKPKVLVPLSIEEILCGSARFCAWEEVVKTEDARVFAIMEGLAE